LTATAVSCAADDLPQTASTEQFITNGEAIDGDLGVVGLMEEDFVFCSGTLIAPRVVITAGHCLQDGSFDPDKLQILFGTGRPGDEAVVLDVIDYQVHPGYSARGLENDLALVLLSDEAPTTATAWPILATPLSDQDVGQQLRIVGYGLESPYSGDTGDKRQGWTTLSSYTVETLVFGPDPSQTCMGDSGGPIFIEKYGVEYLLAVASAGDAACEEHAVNSRADAHYEGFILPYLLRTSQGGAATGETCYFEGNCAEGTCAGLDVNSIGFCTRSCQPSLDNCPEGLACIDTGDDRGSLCLTPRMPVTGGCSTSRGGLSLSGALLIALLLGARRKSS
jgi:V8-like Glu-specific endopeptidase